MPGIYQSMAAKAEARSSAERSFAAYCGDLGGSEDSRTRSEDHRLHASGKQEDERPGTLRSSPTGGNGVIGGSTETQKEKG